jgi:hypothetical protein
MKWSNQCSNSSPRDTTSLGFLVATAFSSAAALLMAFLLAQVMDYGDPDSAAASDGLSLSNPAHSHCGSWTNLYSIHDLADQTPYSLVVTQKTKWLMNRALVLPRTRVLAPMDLNGGDYFPRRIILRAAERYGSNPAHVPMS